MHTAQNEAIVLVQVHKIEECEKYTLTST